MRLASLAYMIQAETKPNETRIEMFTSHYLHHLILVIVLIGIAATAARFIIASRNGPSTPNIRALAAAILPLIAGTWIFIYWRGVLTVLVPAGAFGIAGTMLIGFIFGLVFGPEAANSRNYNEITTVLGSFLCASLFTLLVFAYPASHNPDVFRLYYALAVGVLLRWAILGMARTCYRYCTKCGDFEIRPEGDEYALYFNDVRKNAYESAAAAATTVNRRQTGVPEWDESSGVESPADINGWKEVRRWRR